MGDPIIVTRSYTTKLWEILVPVHDDYGVKFTKYQHEEWQDKVCDLVGGLMIIKQRKGKWKAKKENHIPVRVACDEEQLRSLMHITKSHYAQSSIMAWLVSDTCQFLTSEVDYGV